MSPHWDAAQARRKLRAAAAMLTADALLNQDVVAGLGNIIQNAVLHRNGVHPQSRLGALPARRLGELVMQAAVVAGPSNVNGGWGRSAGQRISNARKRPAR